MLFIIAFIHSSKVVFNLIIYTNKIINLIKYKCFEEKNSYSVKLIQKCDFDIKITNWNLSFILFFLESFERLYI